MTMHYRKECTAALSFQTLFTLKLSNNTKLDKSILLHTLQQRQAKALARALTMTIGL